VQQLAPQPPFPVPLKAATSCSNDVKRFKKCIGEVRGLHTDYVGIRERAADEIDATIPTEALVDYCAVHLVVRAMDYMKTH